MVRAFGKLFGISVVAALIAGCPIGVVAPDATESPTVSDVASKAAEIATGIGSVGGFGGVLMTGYAGHMPLQMGFGSQADLALSAGGMTVRLINQSDADGTFHLSYFASHMGFDDLTQDVNVSAGDVVTVELPCAEIVGLGPLAEPGEPGFHLANGEAIDNIMAVPGFLGQDFACGGIYECLLAADVDDLDGDGDVDELIIVSDALQLHMLNGGPTGHMHGTERGMMGSHMGF